MSNDNTPLRLRPRCLLFPLGLHHLLHVKILQENQKKEGGGGGEGGEIRRAAHRSKGCAKRIRRCWAEGVGEMG